MEHEIHMPKLGMSMKEGTIVKWLKKEGDMIKKGDELAEIMSEKITNTIEAVNYGILAKIVVQDGEVADIGTVIGTILAEEKIKDDIKETSEAKFNTVNNVPVNKNKVFEKDGKMVKEVRPLPTIRKIIGDKMRESINTVPQGTLTAKIDLTQLIELKNDYKAKNEKITMTDLFVKVLGIALEENPILNSSIIDKDWVFYESVNIAIGVPTDDALYTPVIKNVQNKPIIQLSKELKNLIAKVKEGTISIDETTGSTFTLSNLGMFDAIDIITPIINTPESAIMTIGATRKEPVVVEDDKIVIKPIATICLTVDHTNVDGLPVVRFFESIKKVLKNPSDYIH